MNPIKVIFDRTGNKLWFDDPQKEHVSEETSEEIILVKDGSTRITVGLGRRVGAAGAETR